jgi:hypothetical protein
MGAGGSGGRGSPGAGPLGWIVAAATSKMRLSVGGTSDGRIAAKGRKVACWRAAGGFAHLPS